MLNSQGVESLRQTVVHLLYGELRAPGCVPGRHRRERISEQAYNLRFAAKDAADLMDAYRTVVQRAGAHGAVHVLDLTNAKATRAGIRQAKEWLMQAKSNDLVVVFAAGHGMTDAQQNYYFGTYDIDPAAARDATGFPTRISKACSMASRAAESAAHRHVLLRRDRPGRSHGCRRRRETGGAGTVSMRAFKAARGCHVW